MMKSEELGIMSSKPKMPRKMLESDDDQTVLIDIKKLRESLKIDQIQESRKEVAIEQNIEFLTPFSTNTSQSLTPVGAQQEKLKKIILFDYNDQYFANQMESFPKNFDYILCRSLAELTMALKEKEEKWVVFNYMNSPKAVNQLIAQIKSKFSHVTTIIAAQNLSPSKVEIHKNTRYGAHQYLELPIASKDLIKAIENSEHQNGEDIRELAA